MEKTKHSASSEEITKLYTDTYRTRMPLYNDYVFHRIYGRDTDESRAALIGLLNIILERKARCTTIKHRFVFMMKTAS